MRGPCGPLRLLGSVEAALPCTLVALLSSLVIIMIVMSFHDHLLGQHPGQCLKAAARSQHQSDIIDRRKAFHIGAV